MIKISKIDPLGCIIETIDLDECFTDKVPNRYLITLDKRDFIISYHGIDEVHVGMQEYIKNNCGKI